MHRRFHKYYIYLLIVVISMPGLLYIYYEAARLHLHYSMEAAMERTHLEVIKVSTDQLIWEKEGKEMVVNGKMFDVHAIKKESGYYIVSGLFDEKETMIKYKMSLLRNAENQDSRSEQKILTQWHRLQWVTPSFVFQISITSIDFEKKMLYFDQSIYPSPYLQSLLQPPENLI